MPGICFGINRQFEVPFLEISHRKVRHPATLERLERRTLLSTTTVRATDDAYVRDGSYANTNFSTDAFLLVKNATPNDGYVRTTYLKFPIPASGPITSATLELYGSEASGSPEPSISLAVYGVSSNFSQSTLTEANAANLGRSGPIGIFSVTGIALRTYSVDLTSCAKEMQQIGGASVPIAITGTAYTVGSVQFESNRGTFGPELAIVSGAPTPTPTTTTVIQPAAAAYVRDGSYAGTNFGTSASLLVKDAVSGGGYVRSAYVSFRLPTSGPIVSATLQLDGSETIGSPEPSINLAVYGVSPNFSQDAITFDNAPSRGSGAALASINVVGTTTRTYSINLSTYLLQMQEQGATSVAFALAGTAFTTGTMQFASSFAANGPELVLVTG